jgi:hypothetical protein
MILDLTAEQWADVQRLKACAVPGEACSESEVTKSTDGRSIAYCPHQTDGPHYRSPQQFRDADGPCPCGKLTGKPGWTLAPGFKQLKPCPDCRGGKPVVELRVPCPNCQGKGWIGGLKLWNVCPAGCKGESIVVARATVTLLPVVEHDDGELDPNTVLPTVCVCNGQGYLHRDFDAAIELPFDPLPVAGRDWVAVFDNVTSC